jgi:uncharacterized protein
MSFHLTDTLTIQDQPRLIHGGYMVADVRAGRIGIQKYRGVEVNKPDLDLVRVYRPETEVFNKETMASFTSVTVTKDHPPELIDSTNWKKFAVGFTGETCSKDGGFVRVPLIVKDADAISEVMHNGKRELSWGYTCDIDFTPGKTPEGEDYDAIQRNIRGNHLAIVSAGRAGPNCRFGDADGTGDRAMPGENIRKMVIDGITIPVTDEGETYIKKLQADVAKLTADVAKLTNDHAIALATKDGEIANRDKQLGEKDGEIKKLKDEVLTPAAIDKLVSDRSTVMSKAKFIADADYSAGKTPQEIRRMAVAKSEGDAAIKDKSDDYVEALFDRIALDKAKAVGHSGQRDPVADALASGISSAPGGRQSAEEAHAGMRNWMQDAWKKGPETAGHA